MNEQALERLAIESELRRALNNGDLQLYYQPKFDISSLDIVGAECLLRWPHPQRGMISPAVFITIAEETGLIADIDRWVTRSACAQLAQWRREGQPLVPLSINLSGREFWDASFLSVLRSEADAAGVEPRLLEIEITEGVLMRDAQLAKSTLASLKNEGFGLSVDDFGTGFSSLSYLKQFPLDSLKIDRSFVMELETKPENQAICRAIIAMAHSLGLKVIAEGVETDAQLAFLSREECDVAQGYLLGRPMKLEQFATLLAHDMRRRHTLRAPLAAKPRNQPSIQP